MTRFVYMDIDDIRGGQDFVRALDEALNACEVLLAVVGPHWLEAIDSQGRRRLADPSDYVRLEIATALRCDIWVIPILVEGAAMPEAVRLPEDLRTLSTRNALRISNASWHHDVDSLADQIRTLMYAPERAGSAGRPLLPTDFDSGKWLSGQGAETAIVLILMGLLFLGTGGTSGIQTRAPGVCPSFSLGPGPA